MITIPAGVSVHQIFLPKIRPHFSCKAILVMNNSYICDWNISNEKNHSRTINAKSVDLK